MVLTKTKLFSIIRAPSLRFYKDLLNDPRINESFHHITKHIRLPPGVHLQLLPKYVALPCHIKSYTIIRLNFKAMSTGGRENLEKICFPAAKEFCNSVKYISSIFYL